MKMMSFKETVSKKISSLSWPVKLGLGLAIGSFLPWLLLLVLPFLNLSAANKAIGAGLLIALGEAMFWLGAILAGQEIVRRYRKQLIPHQLWKQICIKIRRKD
jgi:hypothetical protein